MDIVFKIEDDPTPYDKTHMHHFTAKSPKLTPEIISDAYLSFKKKFQHGSWYEDIEIVDHRIHEVLLFSETMLGAIQLLRYKRLPHKLCPDDVVVNSTPNECVIDGMLAFLRKWKQFDRKQLITELGSSTPTLDQIKAWVEDSPLYDRYVSLYIVDPFLNCYYAHPAQFGSSKETLTFYANDAHLYPITCVVKFSKAIESRLNVCKTKCPSKVTTMITAEAAVISPFCNAPNHTFLWRLVISQTSSRILLSPRKCSFIRSASIRLRFQCFDILSPTKPSSLRRVMCNERRLPISCIMKPSTSSSSLLIRPSVSWPGIIFAALLGVFRLNLMVQNN
jgi:hypothetical protein